MATYGVVGVGAVGGFYGGRLVQAGEDVHFLFRNRAAIAREQGLEILSPTGDVRLHPIKAYEAAEQMPPLDVVIVAVKAHANDDVTHVVADLVKPDGAVLLIQNGIDGEVKFRSVLPDSVDVLGALAFISSQMTGPNQVRHFDHGQLTIGEYRDDYAVGSTTATMRMIERHFESVGVNVVLVDDLLLARWRKLLWNLPFNGLSVVLDALTDELLADQNVEMIRSLMAEVIAAADADGRTIDAAFGEQLIEDTRLMTPYATSMKVDADNARQLELAAMIGNPLRRAQAHGLSVPRMELLYQQVRFRQRRIALRADAQHS